MAFFGFRGQKRGFWGDDTSRGGTLRQHRQLIATHFSHYKRCAAVIRTGVNIGPNRRINNPHPELEPTAGKIRKLLCEPVRTFGKFAQKRHRVRTYGRGKEWHSPTKGKLVADAGVETYYFMVSAKCAE